MKAGEVGVYEVVMAGLQPLRAAAVCMAEVEVPGDLPGRLRRDGDQQRLNERKRQEWGCEGTRV